MTLFAKNGTAVRFFAWQSLGEREALVKLLRLSMPF
jgi:hypothetical protein